MFYCVKKIAYGLSQSHHRIYRKLKRASVVESFNKKYEETTRQRGGSSFAL
jgi:hypothetical protein